MATVHGQRLLQSLLGDPKGTEKYVQFGLTEELFQGEEVDLYEDVSTHVAKYGKLPNPTTINVTLPEDLENPEYYLEHVRQRHQHRSVVRAIQEAATYIQDKDSDKALDVLRSMVLDTTRTKHHTHIVELGEDARQFLDDEYQLLTKLNHSPGIMTGYPTVDAMMNGLRGGDVMAMVGRPQQGKTFNMLAMAHHVWHTQGKRVLFVSMEMKPLILIQRIIAMHEHMSITLLRKAEYPKSRHKKLMESLSKLGSNHEKFWIIDGNLAASVEDILMLCHQLQPDALFIDGAYMLRTTTDKRLSRWDRIGTTMEIIKQDISTGLGIPSILSYQFNKEGAKKKDLENIGGTDIIGQIASCVLALYEKEEQAAEYTARKKVDIIKGRSGESGEFFINWVFDVPPFMNFSEIVEDEGTPQQMDAYV